MSPLTIVCVQFIFHCNLKILHYTLYTINTWTVYKQARGKIKLPTHYGIYTCAAYIIHVYKLVFVLFHRLFLTFIRCIINLRNTWHRIHSVVSSTFTWDLFKIVEIVNIIELNWRSSFRTSSDWSNASFQSIITNFTRWAGLFIL